MEFLDYDFCIKNIVLAIKTGPERSCMQPDRPSHGLVFAFDHAFTYTFSDTTVLTVDRPDQLLYLPKHSSYSGLAHSLGSCLVISFDLTEDITFPPFLIRIKNTGAVLECFQGMVREWTQKRAGYHLRCKALLYRLLCLIVAERDRSYLPTRKESLIQPAFDYIHDHYTEADLEVSTLARLCNITPEYLRTLFHQSCGASPLSYINRLRMERAKELLDSGVLSVGEVALQSGYTDLSYFSRLFKKNTGYAPSEYKKRKS